MARQYELLSCTFCHKDEIQCLYFPDVWSEKRSGKNALGKGLSLSRSADTWVVQEGCNLCGKSQEEVEAQFRKEGFL